MTTVGLPVPWHSRYSLRPLPISTDPEKSPCAAAGDVGAGGGVAPAATCLQDDAAHVAMPSAIRTATGRRTCLIIPRDVGAATRHTARSPLSGGSSLYALVGAGVRLPKH